MQLGWIQETESRNTSFETYTVDGGSFTLIVAGLALLTLLITIIMFIRSKFKK